MVTLEMKRKRTADSAVAWARKFEDERGYLPTFADFREKFNDDISCGFKSSGQKGEVFVCKIQFNNGAGVRLRWDQRVKVPGKGASTDNEGGTAEPDVPPETHLDPGHWELIPESLSEAKTVANSDADIAVKWANDVVVGLYPTSARVWEQFPDKIGWTSHYGHLHEFARIEFRDGSVMERNTRQDEEQWRVTQRPSILSPRGQELKLPDASQ